MNNSEKNSIHFMLNVQRDRVFKLILVLGKPCQVYMSTTSGVERRVGWRRDRGRPVAAQIIYAVRSTSCGQSEVIRNGHMNFCLFFTREI